MPGADSTIMSLIRGAQYYKIMTARDRKVVSAQVNPYYSIVLVYILQFWEVYYADDLTG